MSKNNTSYPNNRKRLVRIERKCDTILALLRPRAEEKELDRTISLMHFQARRLKDQAIKEAQRFRETLSSRKPRR